MSCGLLFPMLGSNAMKTLTTTRDRETHMVDHPDTDKDDDIRAAVRLPDARAVSAEELFGNAGADADGFDARRLFGGQDRQRDRSRRLDHDARVQPSRNPTVGVGEHVNRILTWSSSPKISTCP